METIQINYAEYQAMVRDLSEHVLRFIIEDAQETIRLMPDGPKAGYYADEINYCGMELKRRE